MTEAPSQPLDPTDASPLRRRLVGRGLAAAVAASSVVHFVVMGVFYAAPPAPPRAIPVGSFAPMIAQVEVLEVPIFVTSAPPPEVEAEPVDAPTVDEAAEPVRPEVAELRPRQRRDEAAPTAPTAPVEVATALPTVQPASSSGSVDIGTPATDHNTAVGPVAVAAPPAAGPARTAAPAPAAEPGDASAAQRGVRARGAWESTVSQTVHRLVRTTPEIERAGVSGEVVLELTIDADGRLVDVRVHRSSGNALIDSTALDQVRRVARFPRPPSAIRDEVASTPLRMGVRYG